MLRRREFSGQENRWHHHDRLARTGDFGRGRACSVRSYRRPQEPPVSNDLALDFSAAAGNQTDGMQYGPAASVARPKSTVGRRTARRRARRAKLFLLQGNRLYWFLTILAATAVAAIIVGRMMIASGAGPGLSH